MKTTIKTGLAALVLLLAISCRKDNTIQSSANTAVIATQALVTDINDPGC